VTDEENDRPAWGKRDPLEVEAKMDFAHGNMDDNYAAAQRRYDRQEPEDFPTLGEPLESTLAQQLADWIEAGGRERLVALIDFVLDVAPALRTRRSAEDISAVDREGYGAEGFRLGSIQRAEVKYDQRRTSGMVQRTGSRLLRCR